MDAIEKLEPPKTRRNLKRILGIFNYFSDLLPSASTYLRPLYQLTSEKIPYKFSEVHLNAFLYAKRQLQKVPLCYLMDLSQPAYFFSDCAMGNSTSYVVLQHNKKLNKLVPCRFQSHTMNTFQQSYSQAKGEALGLNILISEQLPLMIYSHSFLFTDAKALTYISKFRHSQAQVFRWSQLLHSIDLSLIWLPCSNFFLQLVDIFTRPSQPALQHNLHKKIKVNTVADLCFLDFFGLPPMSMTECMLILDRFHELLDTLTPEQVKRQLVLKDSKHPLPDRPHLNIPVTQGDGRRVFLCQGPGVHSIQDRPLSLTCRVGQPTKKWLSDVLNIFHSFFPQMSLDNLVAFQQRDKYIQNQVKLYPTKYIVVDRIVCQFLPYGACGGPADRVEQGASTSQPGSCRIIWPQELNIPLLEKAHIVTSAYHLGQDKTKTLLQNMFKLRNYVKDFTSMTNQCSFCLLNRKHKLQPIPAGLSFNITKPRAFVQVYFLILFHVTQQ